MGTHILSNGERGVEVFSGVEMLLKLVCLYSMNTTWHIFRTTYAQILWCASWIWITWAVFCFLSCFLYETEWVMKRRSWGGGCNCSPRGVLSWSVVKSCIRTGGSILLFCTTSTHLPTSSTLRKHKAHNNYTEATQCCGGRSGAWRAELWLSLWQINSTHNYSSGDSGM